MRIADSENFLSIMYLLLWKSPIDLWLHLVLGSLFLLLLAQAGFLGFSPIIVTTILFILLFYSYYGFYYMGPLIFFSILLRFYLLIVFFLLWLIPSHIFYDISKLYTGLVLAIGYYAFLFAPCSILAAKTGKFVRYRWWLLLPFWPLLFLIAYPSTIIHFFHQIKLLFAKIFLFLKRFPLVILGALTAIALVIALFTGLISGFNWLADFLRHPTLAVDVILTILSVAMCYPMIRMFSMVIQLQMQDNFRWRKWFKMKKEPITYQEFFEATSFHTSIKTLSAIRKLRIQQLLEATAETELFLRNLEFEIELRQRRRIREKHPKSVIAISSLEELEIKDIKDCNHFFRNIGPEVLDEIHKLLEDIHHTRENLI